MVEGIGVRRGEFLIEQHNHVRLQHYVNRLVREPERTSQLALTTPNGNRGPFYKLSAENIQEKLTLPTERRWREILNRGQNAREASVSGIGGRHAEFHRQPGHQMSSGRRL